MHFSRAAYVEAPLEHLTKVLAGVVVAAAELTSSSLAASLTKALKSVETKDTDRDAAEVLVNKEHALILLGQLAMRHPRYAEIRRLAAALADLTGASLGYLPEGANSVGAALAGVLPHRGPGGVAVDSTGRDAHGMLASPRRVYLLFGLEPDHDLADSALAEQALKAADTVICFTPFVTDQLLECADVLLPIGTFAETAGTFVNVEGNWQSFDAAANLVGDAREGWRVLRVLGNELDLPDCEYRRAADVSDALASEIGDIEANNEYKGKAGVKLQPVVVDTMTLDVPMYSVDSVVRRGTALQETHVARETISSG